MQNKIDNQKKQGKNNNMKIFSLSYITISTVLLLLGANSIHSSKLENCYLQGKKLQGKVKVVNNFSDFKVKVVKEFADLKVIKVKNFPSRCGEWQFVDYFPDFTIQFVTDFPDFTIQFAEGL